jgi:predicted SprT family Zn-dependent metalloprotease
MAALVEEQGQRIEALEADLERQQRRSDDRDDKLQELIRELEARDSRVDGRFQLLSATMFDFQCQCGEDKENSQLSANGVRVMILTV